MTRLRLERFSAEWATVRVTGVRLWTPARRAIEPGSEDGPQPPDATKVGHAIACRTSVTGATWLSLAPRTARNSVPYDSDIRRVVIAIPTESPNDHFFVS